METVAVTSSRPSLPPLASSPIWFPSPAFWKGKRVFLTGHTGFKGAWLLLWLADLGATVRGFSLAPEGPPSLFETLSLDALCHHQIGDIRDTGAVRQAIDEFQPDIVLHLAAQALVRRSYRDPLTTFATNVQGTAAVLEACRCLSHRAAIVIVTTDKCYEERHTLSPYREDDHLGGSDPYSASKACAEIVTSSYRRSFFPPERYAQHPIAVASARAGNVFGGGDWAEDRLIPDAFRSWTKGQTLTLRSPYAIRPWQHVLEPLLGYLMLAQACYTDGPAWAQAWNFGPSPTQIQEVQHIIRRLAEAWGPDALWKIGADVPEFREASLLLLDSTPARFRLGWRPALPLPKALAWTAAWYRAFALDPSPASLRTLIEEQRNDFSQRFLEAANEALS